MSLDLQEERLGKHLDAGARHHRAWVGAHTGDAHRADFSQAGHAGIAGPGVGAKAGDSGSATKPERPADSAVGLVEIDLEDHRLTMVNQRYCDMLGYSEDELLGVPVAERTHPDDLDGDRELLARVRREQPGSYERKKRYIRKDGEVIDVRIAATVVTPSVS